ncbi:hypothetical protein ACWEFJ_33670 [Actinosynnema sp. NPDC004786]
MELRVCDLDVAACLLTVARTVEEVEPRFHPTGGRFLVKEYPKDRDFRRLRLRRQLVDRVAAYVERSGLEPGDLLFPFPQARGGHRHEPIRRQVDFGRPRHAVALLCPRMPM